MSDEFDLIVVGNGAACVALLGALCRTATAGAKLRIGVMGSSASLGYGHSFGEDNPALLMNSPVRDMAIMADDREHFANWLRAEGLGSDSEFVPRYLFGRYLRATALALVGAGRHDITLLAQQAIDIDRRDHGHVVTSVERSYCCRSVVLATGGVLADPYRLAGSLNYFPATFPIDPVIDQIRQGKPIFILGSSLSAIDVSLALRERGFDGPISFLSRRGRLPSIKCKKEDVVLRHVSRDALLASAPSGAVRLRTVLRAARRDFRAGGFDWRTLFAAAAAGNAGSLGAEIAQARQALGWLNQVNQMQGELDRVWPHLFAPDRDTLISRFLPDLMHKLAGIPVQNAERLHALFEQGQQHNLRGVREVRALNGRFVATFDDGTTASADYVINATGTSRHQSSALVRSLLDKGLTRERRSGGVDCNPSSGQLLGAAGHPVPGLYALGHLTCGVNPVINHVGAIVGKAAVLAELLTRQLSLSTAGAAAAVPAALAAPNSPVMAG